MTDQTLTIGTLSGPHVIKAPGGWEFNETDAIVWNRLLWNTRDRNKPQKLKRDELVLDGKIYILALVLCDALGMAPPYWINEARRLA